MPSPSLSRSDRMIIARRFNAGFGVEMESVPAGRSVAREQRQTVRICFMGVVFIVLYLRPLTSAKNREELQCRQYTDYFPT